jgi:hypothetical protein
VGLFSYLQVLCGQKVGDDGVRACRSIVKDEAGFAGGIIWVSLPLPPSLEGVGRLCGLSQCEDTEVEYTYVRLFMQGIDVYVILF